MIKSKKQILIMLVILLIIFGGLYFVSKVYKIKLEGNILKITGVYGMKIDLKDIKSVELKNSLPKNLNLNSGISFFNKKIIGKFKSDDLGDVKMFVYTNEKPYLNITLYNGDFKHVIIASKEGTEKLYNNILKQKASKDKADKKNKKFLLLQRPPNITIKSGKIEIASYLGPSEWIYEDEDGTMSKIFRDFDIIKFVENIKNNKDRVILSPKATVFVSCEYKIDSIELKQELGKGEILIDSKNNSFSVPSENGVYCYLINCNWKGRGSGTYGFKIIVSDE